MDLSTSLRALRLLIRQMLGVVDTPSSVIFLPETSLLALAGFVSSGFKCGLEILNDDRTPMEFVVSALGAHVGFDRKDAVRTMLTIHSRGGALLPMVSMEEADKATQAMRSEAKRANLPAVHNRLESEVHQCSNRSAIELRRSSISGGAPRRHGPLVDFPIAGTHKHGYVMYRAVEFDRKRHQQTARHASRVPRCWRNYVAGSHEPPGQCRIGDIKQVSIPAKLRKHHIAN